MLNQYFNKGVKAPSKPDAWDHLHEHAIGLGGEKLDVADLDGTASYGVIYKGCPVQVDTVSGERVAHPVKSALIVAGGTTSAPRVSKFNLYKAGDFVFVSGAAVTVSSVDRSSSEYDVLTLSSACTGATAGAILLAAASSGADPVQKYSANALISRTDDVLSDRTVSCVFKIDEWVLRARLPYNISDADIVKLSPNIVIK